MDKIFQKLKKIEEKAIAKPAKTGAVIRKHTIDFNDWRKAKLGMHKEHVAEIFSVPTYRVTAGARTGRRWCRS